MRNLEIAKIFYEIADLLEMKEIEFKPRAYERAARTLESIDKDIADIYKQKRLKGLEALPGIGESIALKIEEYLKTGKIKDHQKLKREVPVDIGELTAIEGLGPRMVKVLYKKLKIKTLADLEKAAKAGKIRNLAGFGLKTEENILQGIGFVKKSRGRFLLGLIFPVVEEIIAGLKSLKEVKQISSAGSVRRMKETIGDVDILVTTSKPKKIVDYFTKLPEVVKVWGQGPTKVSVRMKQGFDVDIRIVKEESFGSALQYFTGNKDHNIATRKIAQAKGLKLNEYGIFKGKRRIGGKTEKEVYKILGLRYIEPEMRQNNGEIEAARKGQLPHLIDYKDLKGDLQCHSKGSDGSNTIEEMVEAARKLGYQYLAITDHIGSLRIAGAMSDKEILSQMKKIDRLNEKFKKKKINFTVLKGAEVNIKPDGSLDAREKILSKLDIVLAGIHSHFKMPKDKMTKRIIRAMENPWVDIIVHPTGRLIFQRDAYPLDMEKIFSVAQKTDTALEIDAYPTRLDLKDSDVRRAVERGVKLTISTDAHNSNQLSLIYLGIATARRGWAQKKDILNTKPLNQLLKSFKKPR